MNKKLNLMVCLEELFDDTGIFNRSEWAKYLCVSQSTLSQWVNGQTIPRADHLQMILKTQIAHKNDKPVKVALKNFYKMADLPLGKVLKEPSKLKGALNISSYMLDQNLVATRLRLPTIPFGYQLKLVSLYEEMLLVFIDAYKKGDVIDENGDFKITEGEIKKIFSK